MVEAYRIGVHLAMTNGVSSVLGVVAREMLGFQRQIDGAVAGLGTLRTALIGLGAVTIGGAMLAGVGALVRGGSEMVHQQALLRAAGETNQGIAVATGQAWATAAQVMGTTASGNLRALGELRGLLGSLPEANQVLGRFQEFSRVLGVVTGKNDEGAAGVAARMLDLRGAIRFNDGALDEGRFGAEMDAFSRAVITNRGRVSPEQLLGFMQQAGPAGTMLTPQALYGDMSTLIESMGGQRAGTALTAAYRQLVAGVMPQRQARFLEQAGLLAGGTQTVQRRAKPGGGFEVAPAGEVLLSRGGVVGRETLMSNPVAWFDQHLAPAMARAGATNEQQRLDFILKAFSTATGQRFWTQIMLSREQIDRERANQAAVPANAAAGLLAQSPVAARQAMAAGWDNLMNALGSPLVPAAAQAMNLVARALNGLAQAASRNPTAVKVIGFVVAGVGAALVALGTIAIGAAALAALGGGALVGGVLAAGAAIGALVAMLTSFSSADWANFGASIAATGAFFATWGRTLFETLVAAPFRWLRDQIAAVDWLLPWRVLTAAVSNGWQALTERVDQAVAIVAGWSPALGAAIEGFRAGAAAAIQAIVDWIVGLPGRILGALSGTGAGSVREPGAPRVGTLGGRPLGEGFYAPPALPQPVVPPPPPAPPVLERQSSAIVPSTQRQERAAGSATLASAGSPWEAPDAATSRETVVHSHVYLDGRKIWQGVSREMERDLSRPARSGAGFDSRMALPGVEQV